jgi:hypothetical protein
LAGPQDILERGWGWQRLLPYQPFSVQWPKFKGYLQEYYHKNADQVAALIMNNKPEFYVSGIPPNHLACCSRPGKVLQLLQYQTVACPTIFF